MLEFPYNKWKTRNSNPDLSDSSGNNLSATEHPIAFQCYVRAPFRKHKGGAHYSESGGGSVRKVTQELSLEGEVGQSSKEGKGVFSKTVPAVRMERKSSNFWELGKCRVHVMEIGDLGCKQELYPEEKPFKYFKQGTCWGRFVQEICVYTTV